MKTKFNEMLDAAVAGKRLSTKALAAVRQQVATDYLNHLAQLRSKRIAREKATSKGAAAVAPAYVEEPIAKVFGVPADARLTVRVSILEHPMIPKRDPEYVFRPDLLSDILAWEKGAAGDDPLYLVGPTGSGKSSIVTQLAARMRRALYVVSCHERMELPELFGRFIVRNGSMEWADGPLIAGLKDPAGAWILLDEADTLDPGTMVGLNALTEGRSITIPETGEVIDPTRYGARIIMAGNTAGNGDTTGLYQATKRQNMASMGRFMMLEVGYPAPAEEEKILEKAVPGVPEAIRPKFVELANEVRKLFTNGDLEITFCTRTLVRYAMLTVFFKKKPGINVMTYALDRALAYRAEPTSRQAIHELVQRTFGGTV